MTTILIPAINAEELQASYSPDLVVTISKTNSKQNYDFNDKNYISLEPYLNPNEVIECVWCKEKGKFEDGIGIPIRQKQREDDVQEIETTLKLCCYECSYAMLRLLRGRNPSFYIKSIYLLKKMFNQNHPDGCLIPANDFWLLKRYGGPLNNLTTTKSKYYPTPNLIQIPVSQQYVLEKY